MKILRSLQVWTLCLIAGASYGVVVLIDAFPIDLLFPGLAVIITALLFPLVASPDLIGDTHWRWRWRALKLAVILAGVALALYAIS